MQITTEHHDSCIKQLDQYRLAVSNVKTATAFLRDHGFDTNQTAIAGLGRGARRAVEIVETMLDRYEQLLITMLNAAEEGDAEPWVLEALAELGLPEAE